MRYLVGNPWKAVNDPPGVEREARKERAVFRQVSAHAFRHTVGTQSVADEVPVDVVQKVLGHASLQTTSLYVQAEKQRMLEEVAADHSRQQWLARLVT